MSKVSIQGDSSGTGTLTIQAPNTNSNYTLTLPTEAGTVLTSVSAVASSQIATALNASGSAPLYACRAWLNFNGTGTVAIRESGNVSSITDNGTGNYTVNFTTAMPDANYAAVGSSQNPSIGSGTGPIQMFVQGGGSITPVNPSSSAFRVVIVNFSGSYTDTGFILISVFR